MRKFWAVWLFLVGAFGLSALLLGPQSRSAPRKTAWGHFRDLKGKRVAVVDGRARATVALFLSNECPITNRYAPRIVALQRQYAARGVRFLAVFPNNHETNAEVGRLAAARGYTFPVLRDPNAAMAIAMGTKVTPEAVVMDADGRIRYRGAIDDDPDGGRQRKPYVARALDAVLGGKAPAVGHVAALGCFIERPARVTSTAVTYSAHVQPILRARCEPCHRPGETAPFSLTSYQMARAWAPMIKQVTQKRIMPPWKPEPGFGHFRNERRLTDAQVQTLARWADAGAPLGDAKQVRPPQTFPKGWSLGGPDAVLQPETTYTLAADGDDVYQCYSVDPALAGDKWLSAVDIQPGNRAVVHHVIVFLDRRGASKALDDAEPGPGYKSSGGGVGFLDAEMLGGWAPGFQPARLPDGVAQKAPAGSRLVIQVHYHKNGKPETDRTRVGLYWSRKPVEKPLHIAPIANLFLSLPPGQKDIPVKASLTSPWDVQVISVIPHMHLLGRGMEAVATKPDGAKVPLIRITDWDFRWQDIYTFARPIALPAGSRIDVDAVYDNSAGNPRNPSNPPRHVRWGEQTTDEMCLLFVAFTRDDENLATRRAAAR